MSNRFDLEQQYLAAKEAYYSGEPILTDDEFDHLEAQLISLGSEVSYIVGAEDRKAKYSHPSPMLSLAKYQAAHNGNPPTAAAVSWMNAIGKYTFEATPKYDGNAANAIYVDGKLSQILSRGDGSKGRDITAKVKHNLPESINLDGTVEVRGEVVIKVSTFNHKYSQFKNPRNFVAGILNREDRNAETISYLDFIPVEVRHHNDGGTFFLSPSTLANLSHYPFLCTVETENFEEVYHAMEDYRRNRCEYQLDGFVIKAPESLRPMLGENSHDPNWAVAIKFPPKETFTVIERISWQYGKTGSLNPVAIMKPVDLDGSTVTRAALFNYGYVKSMKAYPGATVTIAKSGDIIPQILRVVSPGNEAAFTHPTHCECGAVLKVEGIHLFCDAIDCTVVAKHRFGQSIGVLELDGIGGAMVQTMWNAGFRTALDFLQPSKFNKEILISTGHFKDGKTLENILEQVSRVKELKPAQVLMMLAFSNMGWTTAHQVGKYLHGEKYSFHGLQKDVVAGFGPGEPNRLQYEAALSSLEGIIKITLPERIADDAIGYEMSGSPKAFGFKTKEEFMGYAKSKGYYHSGLKDAKVLFVDDLNTSSSKIKTAAAKGIKILLYNSI